MNELRECNAMHEGDVVNCEYYKIYKMFSHGSNRFLTMMGLFFFVFTKLGSV